MKAIYIAFKDLSSALRSLFMLGFMFGVPIITALMFLLAFGGSGSELDLSVDVALVNLDQGDPHFEFTNVENGELAPEFAGAETMGEVLTQILIADDFTRLLRITEYATVQEGEAAIEHQEAGVVILIPEDFTSAVTEVDTDAVVEVKYDPTLTIGPAIVESILSQIIDGFSANKVTFDAVISGLGADAGSLTPEQISELSQKIAMDRMNDSGGATVLSIIPLVDATAEEQTSMTQTLVMGIMAGMMIFYAFFTGANQALGILREEEAGTLPRLFSTPTSTTTILTGKYLSIVLTVLVQIVVLVVIGILLFNFDWGVLPLVVIAILASTMVATTFGVFLISWMDNSKQAGTILGGVVTATGMLGMVPTFAGGMSSPRALEIASLAVPQGWALRLWGLARDNGSWQQVLLSVGVLLLWSAVFFLIGRHRFSRRYA